MCRLLKVCLCLVLKVPFLLLLPDPVRRLPTGISTMVLQYRTRRPYTPVYRDSLEIFLALFRTNSFSCPKAAQWARPGGRSGQFPDHIGFQAPKVQEALVQVPFLMSCRVTRSDSSCRRSLQNLSNLQDFSHICARACAPTC